MAERGVVYLVGAGPGDPELITVRGLRLLERADVVVYDRLVAEELVELAPPRARLVFVGKAPGDQPWPQRRINALLVAEARRRRVVVRLKGGDPFVFGRGGEECQALAAAGVRFEIVPGVTSVVAAPAHAGIPLTHRDLSSEFAVVTGHGAEDGDGGPDWAALARIRTLVVLMGVARLGSIAGRLIGEGRDPATPVAVIARASTSGQLVVRGRLDEIARRVAPGLTPATVVIGEVAALGAELSWFDPRRAATSPFADHATPPPVAEAADHVA